MFSIVYERDPLPSVCLAVTTHLLYELAPGIVGDQPQGVIHARLGTAPIGRHLEKAQELRAVHARPSGMVAEARLVGEQIEKILDPLHLDVVGAVLRVHATPGDLPRSLGEIANSRLVISSTAWWIARFARSALP